MRPRWKLLLLFLLAACAVEAKDAPGPSLAAMQAAAARLPAQVGVSNDPAALGLQGGVVVAVKAPALTDIAEGLAALLQPDTPVAHRFRVFIP